MLVWVFLSQVRWVMIFFQDFRLTAYHSYPWALEMYYKMGEAIEPENKIREFDLMVWQREGRLEMK